MAGDAGRTRPPSRPTRRAEASLCSTPSRPGFVCVITARSVSTCRGASAGPRVSPGAPRCAPAAEPVPLVPPRAGRVALDPAADLEQIDVQAGDRVAGPLDANALDDRARPPGDVPGHPRGAERAG